MDDLIKTLYDIAGVQVNEAKTSPATGLGLQPSVSLSIRERMNTYDALRVTMRCGLMLIQEALDTRTQTDPFALAYLDSVRLHLRNELEAVN